MTTAYIVNRPINVVTQVASSVFLLAPLYLVLTGTAGIYSPQAVARLADFSPTPIIRVVGRKSQKRYRSTADNLLRVRDTFGFKMSELAEVFGVSRTAAYDWLNGTNPKADIAMKIELLASYADSVHEADGNRIALLRRNPLFAGRALVSAMKSGQDLETTVSNLTKGSIEEHLPFRHIQSSQRIRKTTSDSFSEIVTPVIFERS